MNEHPEDSSKEQSVQDALDEATSVYGQTVSVDNDVLIEELEARGWVYRGER